MKILSTKDNEFTLGRFYPLLPASLWGSFFVTSLSYYNDLHCQVKVSENDNDWCDVFHLRKEISGSLSAV